MSDRQTSGPPVVLFLCTGNFYRSRVAEALFNQGRGDLPWEARSRGFSPLMNRGHLFTPAREFLLQQGVTPGPELDRSPARVTVEEIMEADMVILLNEKEHLPPLRRNFSWTLSRLRESNRLRSWHVHDLGPRPGLLRALFIICSRGSTQPMDSAMEHIQLAVNQLLNELRSRAKTRGR